jgi:hypothetical protein
MMKIFLLMLFSIGLSGQETYSIVYATAPLTTCKLEIDSSFISSSYDYEEFDTIGVEILVSLECALKVVKGYEVRKFMNTSYVYNYGKSNESEVKNYKHSLYLNENKKPLNKNYTIWQTIRK